MRRVKEQRYQMFLKALQGDPHSVFQVLRGRPKPLPLQLQNTAA